MSTPENTQPMPGDTVSTPISPVPTPYPASPVASATGPASAVGAEPDGVGNQAALKPAKKRRRWVWPVATGGAFLLGLGMGGASGGADPTTSEEYQQVLQQRDNARDALGSADARAAAAESRAQETIDAATAREAELDTREAAVAAREAAVTGAEQQAAANQVGNGIWTVGVDIEPGTYRTTEAVTQMCYWGIYRTGSNGDDIIENDIVQGGFPSVTLSAGQDFKTSDCGTWAKQ